MQVGFADRAVGAEMSLKVIELITIKCAEGVDRTALKLLFVFSRRYAARVPSMPRRRCMAERILVLIVPSGSASCAAISVWLKPSK